MDGIYSIPGLRRSIGTASVHSPTRMSLKSMLQVLHIPFTHVSIFFMKHPQCKWNTHAPTMQSASCSHQLQLERESVASLSSNLAVLLCFVVKLRV